MERLTGRDDKSGSAYYRACYAEPCAGMGCEDESCSNIQLYCERLAEYEETGLLPENITAISNIFRDKCEEVVRDELIIKVLVDEVKRLRQKQEVIK